MAIIDTFLERSGPMEKLMDEARPGDRFQLRLSKERLRNRNSFTRVYANISTESGIMIEGPEDGTPELVVRIKNDTNKDRFRSLMLRTGIVLAITKLPPATE